MPLCGILNLSSGSSRSSFSNCVRAFVQPSVIFHECVHSSNSLEFYVGICNELPEFCLMQLAIACFVNFLRGLLTVVLVIPRSANCDSLMQLGQSSISAILISVSQELYQTSKPSRPQIVRSVTSGPVEASVVLRILPLPHFYWQLLRSILLA